MTRFPITTAPARRSRGAARPSGDRALLNALSQTRQSNLAALSGGENRMRAALNHVADAAPLAFNKRIARDLGGSSAAALSAMGSVLDQYDSMMGNAAVAPEPAFAPSPLTSDLPLLGRRARAEAFANPAYRSNPSFRSAVHNRLAAHYAPIDLDRPLNGSDQGRNGLSQRGRGAPDIDLPPFARMARNPRGADAFAAGVRVAQDAGVMRDAVPERPRSGFSGFPSNPIPERARFFPEPALTPEEEARLRSDDIGLRQGLFVAELDHETAEPREEIQRLEAIRERSEAAVIEARRERGGAQAEYDASRRALPLPNDRTAAIERVLAAEGQLDDANSRLLDIIRDHQAVDEALDQPLAKAYGRLNPTLQQSKEAQRLYADAALAALNAERARIRGRMDKVEQAAREYNVEPIEFNYGFNDEWPDPVKELYRQWEIGKGRIIGMRPREDRLHALKNENPTTAEQAAEIVGSIALELALLAPVLQWARAARTIGGGILRLAAGEGAVSAATSGDAEQGLLDGGIALAGELAERLPTAGRFIKAISAATKARRADRPARSDTSSSGSNEPSVSRPSTRPERVPAWLKEMPRTVFRPGQQLPATIQDRLGPLIRGLPTPRSSPRLGQPLPDAFTYGDPYRVPDDALMMSKPGDGVSGGRPRRGGPKLFKGATVQTASGTIIIPKYTLITGDRAPSEIVDEALTMLAPTRLPDGRLSAQGTSLERLDSITDLDGLAAVLVAGGGLFRKRVDGWLRVGGFHEALKVSQYVTLRRMGITSRHIQDPNLRTPSGIPVLAPTRRIAAVDPNTGALITHSEAKSGGVWRKIERQLGKAIERAAKEGLSLEGLLLKIDKVYLEHGVQMLPLKN